MLLVNVLKKVLSSHKLDNLKDEVLDYTASYLNKYYDINLDGEISLSEVMGAVKALQDAYGLVEDGLGPKTLKVIQVAPRCGCSDVQHLRDGDLVSWGIPEVTYYFDRFVDGLSKEYQIATAEQCAKELKSICNLTLRRVTSGANANIIISASSSKSEEFGVSGNVLAWAELPGKKGFTGQLISKFDLAEVWIDSPTNRGIYYKAVLNHEIMQGHAIGLWHTQAPNSLMNPFYNVNISTAQKDEIAKLVQLYGKPVATPTPAPAPSPSPTPTPVDSTLTMKIDFENKKFEIPGYRVQKIGT